MTPVEVGWLDKLKDRPELVFSLAVIFIVFGFVWRIIDRVLNEQQRMRESIEKLTETARESVRIQGSNVQILDYLMRRKEGS